MEFYLSYSGKLSTTGHARQKFKYRRHFQKQLRNVMLFQKENDLSGDLVFSKKKIKNVGDFSFLPLVGLDKKHVVSLDITLLSHQEPNNIHKLNSGDIDNRLKSLLDGLRMAQNNNEIRDHKPEEGEDPFLCLMEDDAIVKEINIRHDKLFFPLETDCKKRVCTQDLGHVFVLIKVKIAPKFIY